MVVEKLRAATVIDVEAISDIEKRLDLAPTHNPNALGCIDASREFFAKDAKQIAIFDTAFHRTIPEIRCLYPLPRQWAEKFEIRRYGFHGINHGYCARRAFQILPQSAERLIICHLGNGCSLISGSAWCFSKYDHGFLRQWKD